MDGVVNGVQLYIASYLLVFTVMIPAIVILFSCCFICHPVCTSYTTVGAPVLCKTSYWYLAQLSEQCAQFLVAIQVFSVFEISCLLGDNLTLLWQPMQRTFTFTPLPFYFLFFIFYFYSNFSYQFTPKNILSHPISVKLHVHIYIYNH